MKTKIVKAKALELARQVAYAKDAIVSRAIIAKRAGSMTLFAFDSGQGLSEHSAPYDAVAQILEGAAEISIGGKLVKATAGQTVIMPARIPHAVKAPARFKMLLTMIRQQ